MAISALLLFVIGTSLVVGLRTLVQWRRTKDTGHRHDTGTRGSAAWWGKQLMGVANLLVAGGPVAALLGLPPVPGLDHRAINVAGLAMMVPNVVAIAGLAAVVAAVQVTVRLVEEPYLVATHGADYLSYAARAGRFVPGVGRLRHAEPWPDAAGSQAGR